MTTEEHREKLIEAMKVKLAEKQSILESTKVLEERAKLGEDISFEDAFSMVPDVEPDNIDKL